MRKKVLIVLGLVFQCCLLIAQTITVTGIVTDRDSKPLSDVSIRIKGTRAGTVTNSTGRFNIQARPGVTLVFSYIGYATREFAITGSTTNLSVTMEIQQEDNLNEVVVTALGIKREKKALGYAVATIDQKSLELRPEGDVVRVLNGKAPGVDIMGVSGISGSGTNIIIRGVSTISGSAAPLFIVDGVPFDASTNAQANFTRGNTTSSRFLDLDPNNIESINVLKGLSATTLYGELGRNGVVVITTKNSSNRRINKGMEITAQQSLYYNEVANLPEYQDSYGGGFDQSLGLAFFSNWGAKFTNPPQKVLHPYSRAALTQAFPQLQGAEYEYKPYKNLERFFRRGVIKTSSLNISAGGKEGQINANYSYMEDNGFTPGNTLRKNTFGIGGSAKLANRFTFSGTMNYAMTDFVSPPTSTSFGSNPSTSSIFGNLIYTPRAVDLMGLPFENPLDKSSVYYRGSNDIQNPLWTVKNAKNGQKVERVYGNMQLKYDILQNLSISYRVGFDGYNDFNYLAQNKGGVAGGSQYQLGIYRTVNGRNTIWDHTLVANWNTSISKDWNVAVDAGINSQERRYEQSGMKSTQQLVYGLFNHSNFIVHENTSEDGGGLDFKTYQQSIGAFAQGIFGYKEFAYVTVGGRNSWTSTLEAANRSLFYPSASVSFIPTSAIKSLKGNKYINYLKIRTGYSTSANFGRPFATRAVLNIGTNVFEDRVGTVINSNSISDRLPNPNLKPELLKEYEIGIEGKFFSSRLNLDLTFYRRIASNQILDRELDPSTGFTVTTINAGSVRNQGIELALGYTVIKSKNWRWQLDGNYTLYRSLVYDLPKDVKQIVVGGFTNEGLFAMEGQPLGVIQANYTRKYTDPSGKQTNARIVDANGDYVSNPEIGIIGNPIPDYKLTGISTLDYKAISFRMQWDYTKGGDILAYTPGTLVGRGLTKDTDFDRELPLILPGVKADGTPNDIQISASRAYFNNYSGFFGMQDLITYDATVIRLREVSLAYTLPAKVIKKTPFGTLQIVFSGQNLFYYAPNIPKYTRFDPETSSLGVSNVRGLEYLSGPTSKRYGASIRLTF